VPAVIATSAPVGDSTAARFAIYFYQAMAESHRTLAEAFDDAIAAARTHSKSSLWGVKTRGLLLEEDAQPDKVPWGLYYREDKCLEWKLPAANGTQLRTYNKNITRRLVEAMRPWNENADRLCRDFAWLDQSDNLWKVQNFIFKTFIGEIGKQLRVLITIGIDEKLDAGQKQKDYACKCRDIAKRTLDLVNFTLLSEWWENNKSNPKTLNTRQQQVLNAFFEKDLDTPAHNQLELLHTLLGLFREHQLKLPFAEIADLEQATAAYSSLDICCRKLENAAENGPIEQAEELLGDFMQPFGFLCLYRMASVKRISYRKMRNGKPEFQHRYVALGIDVKFAEDTEKERWADAGEQVPAVLLFKGDNYENGISLFPFIIDYNALTLENGAKVCFFNTRSMDNPDAMEYLFLGDNSTVPLLKEATHAAGRRDGSILEDAELCKLNLNCVVDAFREAQHAIFSKSENLFDHL
jgi:hypothetical protein